MSLSYNLRQFNEDYLRLIRQVAESCQNHDLKDSMVIGTSLQFHHTQMDGAHASRFLENLQKEIENLKV